jgi:hypothetical protein
VGGTLWRHIVGAATHAMIENVEHLLSKAQAIVPHDEGTLEASGTTDVYVAGRLVARGGPEEATGASSRIGVDPNAIVGVVAFNTAYALAQHERLDYHHKPGRKAKYLEDPLKEHGVQYQQNLDSRVHEALGG